MNTKEKFKDFVKNHPELISHVRKGKMSWQGFYEIYDMYGEDEKAWNDFFSEANVSNAVSPFDIMNFIKNVDLDGIQEGINSIQRVLGLLQDMTPSGKTSGDVSRPRPLYRHFED
ncbi:MAG: hypothetical protein IKG40_02630 [Bacilli bacterium]|nr:hypothetical protein [Bacilli bacterium]